jgi:hypothetical protein
MRNLRSLVLVGAITALQFRDLPRGLPIIRSPETQAGLLSWARNGNYAVVDGVHHVLIVALGGRAATITNRQGSALPAISARPAAPSTEAAAAAASVTASACQDAGADLAELRVKIAATEAELADARAQLAALQDAIAQHQPGASGTVMLRFDEHGAELVTPALVDELVPMAEQARRVVLKGRVAAAQRTDAGRDLALKRALLVRQLLISKGVSAAKIRLFYSSGGFLVAPLDSPEGRAKNSRVEVHFTGAGDRGATT